METGGNKFVRGVDESDWEQVKLGDIWGFIKILTVEVVGDIKRMFESWLEALTGRGVCSVWILYLGLAFAAGIVCGMIQQQRIKNARTTAAATAAARETELMDDDEDDSDFSLSASESSTLGSSSTSSPSNSSSSDDDSCVLPKQEQSALETENSSNSTSDTVFPFNNQSAKLESAEDTKEAAQYVRVRRGGKGARSTAQIRTRRSARIQEASSG